MSKLDNYLLIKQAILYSYSYNYTSFYAENECYFYAQE